MTGKAQNNFLDDGEKIIELEIERLHTFKDHPFSVVDDEQMMMLKDSIEKYGILVPLIVRPLPEGVYEIISGHRRKRAAELLGHRKVPLLFELCDLYLDDRRICLSDQYHGLIFQKNHCLDTFQNIGSILRD